MRRAGTTALISLVIAALAVGGAAVYGLLTGASNVDLKNESVVFLEKGSGARYVYLQSDGKLHPVLNYTSGLLIANAQEPKMVSTSRQRLATMPLGDPLGIPDAPDSLPTKKDLLTGDWTVCSAPPAPGTSSADALSTLVVGGSVTGGTVAAAPNGGRGVLVRDPSERTFLIFNNRRFQIPNSITTATLRALGWAARQPTPVAAAFINSVPLGPDLRAPRIEDKGGTSGVDGERIGQLFTDGQQWAVAVADGAAALTEVQAKLLTAQPDAYPVRDLDPTQFNALPLSPVRFSGGEGFPANIPELLEPQERLCMTLPVSRETGAGLRVDAQAPAGAAITGDAVVPGGVQADFVYVPRGKGALVVAAASPTAPAGSGTVSVVTDTARRYPIANRDLLGRLGYGSTTPQQVPAQLIALLPQGPSLDADKAREAATTQQ
jgi:type VII secretion protein EccB